MRRPDDRYISAMVAALLTPVIIAGVRACQQVEAPTMPEEVTTTTTTATTTHTEAPETTTATTTAATTTPPQTSTSTTTEATTAATTTRATTTAETLPEPTGEEYPLTAAERDLIARVVMAEAGAEELLGQIAVAQCIRNACEIKDLRPAAAIAQGGYTSRRKDPSQQVLDAVAAVFDEGVEAVDAPILYFYAPATCYSAWHESQTFAAEIGGHRFFY